MSLDDKVHEYLRALRLARQASTENRSRQMLFEALPFLDNGDPRQGGARLPRFVPGPG